MRTISMFALAALAAGCGGHASSAPPLAPVAPAAAPTAATPPPPPSADAKLAALLAELRRASGGDAWAHVAIIQTKSDISVGGMTGTLDAADDVATGRHRNTYTFGGASQADGFDGKIAWTQMMGGEVTVPDSPEALAESVTEAWAVRRGYFSREHAHYELLPDVVDGGTHYRRLDAIPDGGARVELWIDDAGMVAKMLHHDTHDLETTAFADYRDVGGIQLPFKVTVDEGDPRNLLTVTTTEAHAVPQVADQLWTRPDLDAGRVAFRKGATSTVVNGEVRGNHVYVRALIDGKPVRLIVDTGGVNMLTPAAAKRLGIKPTGTLGAGGFGGSKASTGIAHARTLAIGDAVFANPVIYVVDVGDIAAVEDERFDGLVGFEMFERLAVRIDYDHKKLTLTQPAAFVPPPGAQAVHFTMTERMPIVDGAIDGIPGRFRIDTGDSSALVTFNTFTTVNKLAAKYHPKFTVTSGYGVGGATHSQPVRFAEVKIGDVVVNDVLGELAVGDGGASADTDASANLGAGILRRFVVTFDYSTQTMYLEPGADHDLHEVYDRAGMLLVRDGKALKVYEVIPGSPAADAGIVADDRILAIAGAPVASKSQSDWRKWFRESDVGKQVVLRVRRGAATSTVTITLADLVP